MWHFRVHDFFPLFAFGVDFGACGTSEDGAGVCDIQEERGDDDHSVRRMVSHGICGRRILGLEEV